MLQLWHRGALRPGQRVRINQHGEGVRIAEVLETHVEGGVRRVAVRLLEPAQLRPRKVWWRWLQFRLRTLLVLFA